MKKCFKCNKQLPFIAFYKHSGTTDGYLGKCKECTKIDSRENRIKNIDRIREYDRIRGNARRKRFGQAHNLARKIKVKQECMFCGSREAIEKHHPDYSKPTYVVPLCRTCHRNTHAIVNIKELSDYIRAF